MNESIEVNQVQIAAVDSTPFKTEVEGVKQMPV